MWYTAELFFTIFISNITCMINIDYSSSYVDQITGHHDCVCLWINCLPECHMTLGVCWDIYVVRIPLGIIPETSVQTVDRWSGGQQQWPTRCHTLFLLYVRCSVAVTIWLYDSNWMNYHSIPSTTMKWITWFDHNDHFLIKRDYIADGNYTYTSRDLLSGSDLWRATEV